VESVYSAVRADCLYKADYVPLPPPFISAQRLSERTVYFILNKRTVLDCQVTYIFKCLVTLLPFTRNRIIGPSGHSQIDVHLTAV
jgi:hypothetical protein